MADQTIWVWVEVADGAPHPLSLELLTLARKLGNAEAVVFHPEASSVVEALGEHGATVVHLADDAQFGDYLVDPHVKALEALIQAEQPNVILFPSMFSARDVLARIAARMGVGVVANATDINTDDGTLKITAPYGGETIGTVTLRGEGPALVQIRPKAFPVESVGGSAEARPVSVDIADADCRVAVLETVAETSSGPNLEEAEVIVSGGRGLSTADNYVIVEELAATLKGAPGASRAIVDAGWVPYSHQVGQTGKVVKPKLYIAVGISGAIQHLVGMQGSANIIAINTDEEAPIFDVADLSVVGDALTVVPALVARLRELS